jgi:hypothetical protein
MSNFTVERDGTEYRLTATKETGSIHIAAIEEVAGLETAMIEKNYPTDIIIHHRMEAEDIIERGPMGGETEIGLYIEELPDFAATACASPYDFTVSESVRPYFDGLGGTVR